VGRLGDQSDNHARTNKYLTPITPRNNFKIHVATEEIDSNRYSSAVNLDCTRERWGVPDLR
jgi:hypothetical protein